MKYGNTTQCLVPLLRESFRSGTHCVMVIYVFGNECTESKIGSVVELLGVMRGHTLHHISGLVGLQCRNGMQGTAGLSSRCVCFAHKPRCKLTGL